MKIMQGLFEIKAAVIFNFNIDYNNVLVLKYKHLFV